MVNKELTFQDYIKVGAIYSGLSEEEVLAKARETQRDYHYPTLELGLGKYLRILQVPSDNRGGISYLRGVLQLGRKISPLELEALRLRDRIKEAGYKGIDISIEGLE